MSENAIEARDLRKTYRRQGAEAEKVALKGVDLTVPTGSVFGLLGPNGAGKSTLINILAGLVRKTSGTVRIWGFDQDVNPRMSRASIGVVPQELNIDPFLSPAQALEVQAGLYGVPAEQRRTREILEALGLGDKMDAYARTLSGGMRRRLLVAKAMVHAPPVLVLDEPTAGVDLELRRQLWDYVKELNAGGVTVILTTHYLEEAQEMCDQIAIIHQGAVVTSQPTEKLLASIDRKTAIIRPAGTVAELDDLARALPKGATVVRRPESALAIEFARRDVSLGQILQTLTEAGVEISDLSTEEPDLEDVFLALTTSGGVDGLAETEGGRHER
ncbi:MAG: ABC transporter ATP-binding protein [Pseudomonadota bacterium]